MIYVFLTEGFEEIEAMAPIDILRRCKKEVVTVGIGGKQITSSRGITVLADITAGEASLDGSLEMIVLPGGSPGWQNLAKSDFVKSAVEYCVKNNILIGAICGAPAGVLGPMGVLNGKKAVCYPGLESMMEGAIVSEDPVCVDGNIITSRAAGTSIQFALKLAELAASKEESDEVAESIVF
jgi:4-methyl-5(b-hydroxyethyl)-thiazole monophosphate biosynthesis